MGSKDEVLNSKDQIGSIQSLRKAFEQEVSSFYKNYRKVYSESKQQGSLNSIETGITKIFSKYAERFVEDLKLSLKDLDTIRSKYLPWELQREILASTYTEGGLVSGSGVSPSSGIRDSKYNTESYENAFMRALGMPKSNIFYTAEGNKFLSYRSGSGVINQDLNFLERVLLSREIVDLRDEKISESFFDLSLYISKKSYISKLSTEHQTALFGVSSKYSEQYKNIDKSQDNLKQIETKLSSAFYNEIRSLNISLTKTQSNAFFTENVLGRPLVPEILSMFSNFRKYNYLFFPPVQNHEISECISRPESIVKPPFEFDGPKIVNRSECRNSLLETILRIRLDKSSGLRYDKIKSVLVQKKIYVSTKEDSSEFEEEIKFEDFSNSISIVESIIINRLFLALEAACKMIIKETEVYVERSLKTLSSLTSMKKESGTGMPESGSEEPDSIFVNSFFGDGGMRGSTLEALESLKITDDSILFLLSQKEVGLDSLGDGVRSSSIRESALFDAILTSISFPGKFIDQEIKRINKTSTEKSKKSSGPKKSADKIDDLIGIYRGVGIVDLLCFCLAMFTVSEKHLIGMLSEKGFSNLRKEKESQAKDFFKELLKDDLFNQQRHKIQSDSLLEFSKQVNSLYAYSDSIISGNIK